MATYTRNIGRISSAVPAWRAAMREPDRLYYVGSTTPFHAPALPGMPTHFGSSGTAPDNFGAGWDVMSGYSSGTLIEGLGGAFGTMVYGSGGHTRLQNQILSLDLNQDDPSYNWWQAPTWKTSDSGGAELYYSPTEEAALVAGPRGTAARIRGDTNEVADAAAWDRRFPVACDGWIFPRRLVTGQMGDGVPHGFRYATTQFIPSSVTGGDAMYLAINGPQGPFAQSYIPSGTTDAEWFEPTALDSRGRRRWPYYLRNCRTGTWSVHQWQPQGFGIGGFGGNLIGVFRDLRRVYVVGSAGSSYGWYYLDFSNGIAGHTVSSLRTGISNGAHRYISGAFSDGDPQGRHFAVLLSNETRHNTKLLVYDFDADGSFLVDLAAQGFSYDLNSEKVGMSWDPASQRVRIVMQEAGSWRPYYWSIAVPSVLSSGSNWIATKVMPDLGDAAMSRTHFGLRDSMSFLYGKSRLIPQLNVILVPFSQQRMLGFVPGA